MKAVSSIFIRADSALISLVIVNFKRLLIFNWLIYHSLLSAKRSSSLFRKAIIKVVSVLLMLLFLLAAKSLIFNLDNILISFGKDVYEFLGNIFIPFYATHLLLQMFYFKSARQNIKPYLILNISRNVIAKYMIVRYLIGVVNLFFFLVIVIGVVRYFPITDLKEFAFVSNIVIILFINTSISYYLKILAEDFFVIKTIGVIFSMIFLYLSLQEKWYILSSATLSLIYNNTILTSIVELTLFYFLFSILKNRILKRMKHEQY